MTRFSVLFPLISALIAGADLQTSGKFEAHEWGTFTSIAGANGLAERWEPYGGPTDLPCFVHRLDLAGGKANLSGTVRMETPVIYFYSRAALSVNVRVDFPQGFMTEWYPQVGMMRPGTIPKSVGWAEVKVQPGDVSFPWQAAASHYYAARATDAVPVNTGEEREKFLFYRGVGDFQPPIAVKAGSNGEMTIRNLSAAPIPATIRFENHRGQISYRSLGPVKAEIAAAPGEQHSLAVLRTELENLLVAQGLFTKEAHAMVETWHDSWFEEGARVIYVLPQSEVDSILPLKIEPRPDRIARVFVGRVEVFTPEVRDTVARAMSADDRATLEKYGRFLEPIARQYGPLSDTVMRIASVYFSRSNACGSR